MSNVKTRWVFKLFFAWQEAAEARWLAAMSAKGWHLIKAAPMAYKFERGEPMDIVYRFDFQTKKDAELGEYFEIAESAGWTHVCNMGGWHYFRTAAEAAAEVDFFSDAEGQIQKYQRVLVFLAIVCGPNLYITMMLLSQQVDYKILGVSVLWIPVTLSALAVYAFVRLLARIRRLRQQTTMA